MRYYVIILMLLISQRVYSQIEATIENCETMFKANNLQLLAEKYNIESAKAAVIQAKIWDLPYLSFEINAVNPQDNKFFDIGSTGEKSFAIQQLIYLGGKKEKEIDFAKSNVQIAELQFEQLMLNLRYQLHKSFYQLYFNLDKLKSIRQQLNNIDSLISSYSIQSQKGNVPLKDLVRLQSLSLTYRKELTDLQSDILSDRNILKLFTNSNQDIIPVTDSETLNKNLQILPILPLSEIQKLALERNPEYLTSLKIIESNELMLKWQKSLSVPDLNIGASYDQTGGAFKDQINLTFGISLPFWNKNKGNEQIAEAQINQNKTLKEMKEKDLSMQVSTIYQNIIYQKEQYNQINGNMKNLEIVYNGVLENFFKRNVSILEFTDFMESYNQSIILFTELKKQYLLNLETLNYLTNQKVM